MALPLLARLRNATLNTRIRPFVTTPILAAKPLPPRRTFLDSELEENFLKGSGPGGQKINKTSSAVQLKHLPTGIVVKCQDTRSRTQNRKTARKILGEKIEELELGDGARTVLRANEERRRKASAGKKKRRKYKALAGGKEDAIESEEGEVDGEKARGEDVEGDAGSAGKAG